MEANTNGISGTHPYWQLAPDLHVLAVDPFNGELSNLRKTADGVLVCDLSCSLPDLSPAGGAANRELLANAARITASGDLLNACMSARKALASADFFGPQRGKLIEKLDMAILKALKPAEPSICPPISRMPPAEAIAAP
jgi:hypothetical protein